MPPTVSIIIPTYNRDHLICESLESVFAQTYTDYEVIVVNDGSTDNTEEVLAPYMNRIRYIKQENAGPSVARNRGMLNANGEYIAFLDSDDIWFPEKLEKQIALMQKEDADLCFTDYTQGEKPSDPRISYNQELSPFPYKEESFFYQICCGCIYRTTTVLLKRNILATSGIFDMVLCGGEDQDLWIRITHQGKVVYLNEILAFAREHNQRTVHSLKTLRSIYHSKKIIAARWLPLVDLKLKKVIYQSVPYWLSKLAWAEREAGNTKEAGTLFLEGVLYYRFSWNNLFRGIVFRYFTPLVDSIDRLRGKKKP